MTGKTMPKAIKTAIRERFDRLEQANSRRRFADRLDQIALYCANLPVRDDRSADEIIGYDESGLPG